MRAFGKCSVLHEWQRSNLKTKHFQFSSWSRSHNVNEKFLQKIRFVGPLKLYETRCVLLRSWGRPVRNHNDHTYYNYYCSYHGPAHSWRMWRWMSGTGKKKILNSNVFFNSKYLNLDFFWTYRSNQVVLTKLDQSYHNFAKLPDFWSQYRWILFWYSRLKAPIIRTAFPLAQRGVI